MRDVAARTIRTSNVQRIARTSLAFAALLGLACDPGEPRALHLTDPDLPVQAMHFEPNAAVLQSITVPQQPPAAKAEAEAAPVPVGEVFWTAREPKSVQQQASEWGLKYSDLLSLNPDLTEDAVLPEGARLKVYQHDPENPPQSIGSPNRGKLRNAMPLPEGEAWRLRPVRRRAWGTHVTVTSLVEAFEAYGEHFPDGPKIRVGELAKRSGGRISPHASHRSGRDVDIGYVFRGDDDGEDRWRFMHERNFDAEKNWYLIQEILASGNVQTIYISKKLQKLLHKEAAKTLPPEQLAALFEYPRTEQSPHATLQHWKGHHNHMHVRFQCEPGNRRCRSRGR
jgi:hypothetical protein